MIFVTVGTHEQQFDRLVKEIDLLRQKGIIKEEVFIQTGYSNYEPKYSTYSKLIDYEVMVEKTKKARIVITHGGPGSIMLALSENKIPIVVPRNVDFGEHVDNHQVFFSKRLEKENKIISIYNIEDLENKIINYDNYILKIKSSPSTSNLNDFITKLEKASQDLLS